MKYLLVVLMLVSGSVFAGGRDARSDVWARSEAHGGSAKATQSQVAKSYSGGNTQVGGSQSVQFQAPSEMTIRQAPDVSAPVAYATAPCRIAVSGGVSFLTGGVSAGGSVQDQECDLREWVRVLESVGQTGMALNVACNSEMVRKSNPGVCK